MGKKEHLLYKIERNIEQLESLKRRYGATPVIKQLEKELNELKQRIYKMNKEAFKDDDEKRLMRIRKAGVAWLRKVASQVLQYKGEH